MELYILSKQDLSILSICKLAEYQINLDEETNAKSTFTLMKTNGLKKENYMVLNGLYRQFIFVIDDVQTEKESDVVTVTALDISNVFNRKVIEKNIDIMKSKAIEEFLANTISENFVNSDDTALNVNYIEIYWHTNTQGNVATNAENGLYNFHTFLTNCRQYKNIYTDFKLENLGKPQTVEGKRISVEAKNRKIVDISLHGESTQNGTPTPDNPIEIENIEGKNIWNKSEISEKTSTVNMNVGELNVKDVPIPFTFSSYLISNALTNTNVRVAFMDSNNSDIGAVKVGNTVTSTNKRSSITINEIPEGTVKIKFGIRLQDGGHTEKTQLEAGTVATPYVPYNSLEIKDVGENLFNISKVQNVKEDVANCTLIEKNANGVKIQGATSTATDIFAWSKGWYCPSYSKASEEAQVSIKEPCTIKLSADVTLLETVTEPRIRMSLRKANGDSILVDSTVLNLNKKTRIETTFKVNPGKFSPFFALCSNTFLIENIMISTTGGEYKPYQEQKVTFPLSEGQKLMEGSYLADDGIHHSRKQVVFDGSDDEGWSGANFATEGYIYTRISDKKAGRTNFLCTHFPVKNQFIADANTMIGNATQNVIAVYPSDDVATSLEEWKAYLVEHPITVEYDLAEPETVPYTAEQQEAWNNIKNLTLFEGVNHISSDANMVLKYYPLEPVGLKFVLRIDIENKQETTELIDTTLPEVADYNKIYEEDVTAKVQVYIREDGSEYNLYLKTDRTTTTNKDDPDRASGKIEVISVETADRAAEEALNVMKGNNYKHLVEFKIAKTSKLMDITELHIGRPIRIKTDDDIYDSYISAITLSDENFVYFKSGSLRITLLDKLKASNNSVGNKLDVTGGKILGNLNILDNAYFGKDGVSFGAPYDEDKGGPLQLDGARIIESGSNSNGSYIKFSDGTMICYMNKLYSNINITKAWGSMYETDPINLGNFPANFVNIPTVTATCTGGSTVFIEAFTPSETSLGASWFARPSALANTETIISFIAIGKWK